MNDGIKLLDELGAEFARVAAEAERRSRPRVPAVWGRRALQANVLLVAILLAAALGGTAYAVPAARTAVDSLTGAFFAWVSGAPAGTLGHVVSSDHGAPPWFTVGEGESRVVARAYGITLRIQRHTSRGEFWYAIWMGEGRAIGGLARDLIRHLKRHAVYPVGWANFRGRQVLDAQGRVPLFALAARDVARVRVRYQDSGPSLLRDVSNGGVVLLVDAWRPLRDLIAYDRYGRVIGREDLLVYDLRYLCEKDEVPVCRQMDPMRAAWPLTTLAWGA